MLVDSKKKPESSLADSKQTEKKIILTRAFDEKKSLILFENRKTTDFLAVFFIV